MVVIGSYLVALVIEVERIPAIGETVNGGGYFETHGGKGSNMAVQAARLGARCVFVGRVGDDARGQAFRAMLTGEGVGTDHLHLQEGIATGVGFVLLGPGGQNMIAIDRGANAQFSTADVDRVSGAMRPPATVLAQLEIPLATAMRGMRRGREAGCTTILNPAPAQDLSGEDLSNVSVITPNETEARAGRGPRPRAPPRGGPPRARPRGQVPRAPPES
ncbi:MAG: ribokinase, partial [Spirochaetaceae bacterium]|nr:ribokinase [Spirochaetaceae bacterium]